MYKAFLKKLITLVIGYPLYLSSFLFKREEKRIVVGSHTPFNDNSKYFFLFAKNYLKDYEIIWITNEQTVVEKIRSIGYKSHKIRTLKGLYYALTAKYYIYSFHLIDINFWTSGGSIKFNLWHGIPLKDIAFAIKSGPSASLYNEKSLFSRVVRPHVFIRPDYMLTTSEKMSKYFAKAFRIKKEQCLKFGMTRCDILFWEKNKIKDFISKYESSDMSKLVESFSNYKKIFIYMPTWREEVDFLNIAGFDFDALNDKLKSINSIMLFKLHPFTKLKKISLSDIEKYSNIIVMDSEMDIYPILPFTDCLITDYSSIYYDYLLLNKSILLYPFDYDSYVTKSRDLAFDYDTHMPGYRIKNFHDFLYIIGNNDIKQTKEQKKIKDEYFELNDSSSIEQLCNFIRYLNKK